MDDEYKIRPLNCTAHLLTYLGQSFEKLFN